MTTLPGQQPIRRPLIQLPLYYLFYLRALHIGPVRFWSQSVKTRRVIHYPGSGVSLSSIFSHFVTIQIAKTATRTLAACKMSDVVNSDIIQILFMYTLTASMITIFGSRIDFIISLPTGKGVFAFTLKY